MCSFRELLLHGHHNLTELTEGLLNLTNTQQLYAYQDQVIMYIRMHSYIHIHTYTVSKQHVYLRVDDFTGTYV